MSVPDSVPRAGKGSEDDAEEIFDYWTLETLPVSIVGYNTPSGDRAGPDRAEHFDTSRALHDRVFPESVRQPRLSEVCKRFA